MGSAIASSDTQSHQLLTELLAELKKATQLLTEIRDLEGALQ
jgi:hypothetical protein